jgi:hypothetical protein
MRFQSNLHWAAVTAVFLLGISLPVPADNTMSGTSVSLGPKSPIVDWRSVESGDYQTYVKNLQAIGCPPQTVQAIVTADVIAAFSGKRAEALAARYQNFQYWESDPSVAKARAELAARQRAIDDDMSSVLQLLLGVNTDLPDFNRLWKKEELDYELAFLNPDKSAATKAVLLEYVKVNQQMKELSAGLYLTEDTNELQQILGCYQQEQSTLQQMLLPEEYQQVEMTTSWTAENLRHAMVHFEPTEEEFRIIFEAWQPHDEALARIYANRQSDPGNKQVYAKIKAQLSAARYEQYCDTWWK